MVRVIGRLDDLALRPRGIDEQRLADTQWRWSFADNRSWLRDGVRSQDPFLQVSAATPGSVLAWEIDELRSLGCVRIGPFWIPARWLRDGASYRRAIRALARHVQSFPGVGAPIYEPKASAELDPLLALWPHVLALPSTGLWSIDAIIEARAWPVHVLGVMGVPTWADGAVRSPAEFFFHDVDHARFKVREDLKVRGQTIPDAYRPDDPSADERAGQRAILPAAQPFVDDHGWKTARWRAGLARRWLGAIAREPRKDLADAARWLLFELVHEKSLPIEPGVLIGELAATAHVDKLRAKCAAGFYAAAGPGPAALSQLDRARGWLRHHIRQAATGRD